VRFLSLNLVTGPVAEPVSLALAKQHLRIDFSYDDNYIPVLITAAREWCEVYMQRHIFNQTWQRTLDYFPIWVGGTTVSPNNFQDWMFFSDYWSKVMIQLPGKIQSVNSITYVVPNGGGTQTLPSSDYVVDLTSVPARLVPQQGMTWPVQTLYQPGSVAIEYVAGSWEKSVTEQFTVPASAPYTYTLQQANNLVNFVGVTDADDNAVSGTNDAGTLTFEAAQAGQTLTASYTVNACPQAVVQAMLLLIKHWYDHREAVSDQSFKNVPMAVNALLNAHRLVSFYIA
jgi:hypothetical protein